MATHNLTDKDTYPKHHLFVVNCGKMNVFSKKPIKVGDNIHFPKGQGRKVISIVTTEEPANYLIEQHPKTFENTSFYHLKIS